MGKDLSRRGFVRTCTAGLGVGAMAMRSVSSAGAPENIGPAPKEVFVAPPIENVRIGYVGTGGMGTSHVRNLVKIPGCQVTAVCDIREKNAEKAAKHITDAGFPKPKMYTKGDWDFKRMCAEEDLDLVYTATPWEWHVPVICSAMENGKHAATEVPAAYTVEDCWKMVEYSEKFKKHCIMMENCCYDRFELLVLNMVKLGLLGNIMHNECGYLHDLRAIKFEGTGEGLWRRQHAMDRDGDLYPTHGLGPIAQCCGINRGNQFDYIVAMGSPSRGLRNWAAEHFKEGDPRLNEKYKLSDVVTTMIKCKNGAAIMVQHDTNLPRPYSRDILVQGTKGIAQKYPEELVYIEGVSTGHDWDKAEEYYKKYEHPVRAALEEASKGAGHGGMDFIEDWRLINALNKGIEPDMDVYDAAAWSVVGPISGASIAAGSAPVEVPDFTRGAWKKPRELQVMRPETY